MKIFCPLFGLCFDSYDRGDQWSPTFVCWYSFIFGRFVNRPYGEY